MKENTVLMRIQNFRSLKDVTIELNDVHLFIGPNNSGKSNVLKALKFFADCICGPKMPLDNVLKEFFYMKNLPVKDYKLNRFLPEQEPIAFTFFCKESDSDCTFYRVEVFGANDFYQAWGQANYSGSIKEFILTDMRLDKCLTWFKRFDKSHYHFSSSIGFEATTETPVNLIDQWHREGNKSTLVLYGNGNFDLKPRPSLPTHFIQVSEHIDSPLFSFVWPYFAKLSFYSIEVDYIKKAANYAPSSQVSTNADNIVSFIDDLDNNHPVVLEAIKRDLTKCIPEIINFKCPVFSQNGGNPERKLKFFEANGNSYWADETSEGVLYFLALLCILYQPNPPKILLLEEPENGIHPRRIADIMEYLFELAETKGIKFFITSHSPLVLDQFTATPENVLIFDRPKGSNENKIAKLTDVVEDINQKASEMGMPLLKIDGHLSSHWLSGVINGVPS